MRIKTIKILHSTKTAFFILWIFFCLASCKKGIVYTSSFSLNNHWEKDSIYTFEINKSLQNKSQNIYFLLRNNEQYRYSNIYFFTTFENPKGIKEKDTLQYRLAAPDGHWLGKGIGSVKENLLLYRENENFPDSGTYKINIQQGMRVDTLRGLENIGIIIQKVQVP